MRWTVAFNPSYAYIKPWWMAVLSFKFLTGNTIDFPAYLSPGFCPYKPSYTLLDVLSIQNMLDNHFQNNDRKITSVIWDLDHVPFPGNTYDKNATCLLYTSPSPRDS
eukprot:TRINITY_DN3408_c0_g3_i4.p1 TRINITY_DN3408_c0_g3~~TRINITY_DN3408_c0_g3_i4.p1  ORF type:complete len:107 (-),score=13.76 TRINITY_DN3408_c0_g3_i4:53-373(-)